jgi:serine/threonine-protein kinase
MLYEIWKGSVTNNMLQSTGCLATWDLTKDYGGNGRGVECTSADAAGYPIAALMLTADDVASGTVTHAIRFIVPNGQIQSGQFLKPATHSAGAGGSTAVPYGAHLRLKASFDMTKLTNSSAKIIAKGLQTYGMFLADAGMYPLTFASDQFTTHKWAALGMDPNNGGAEVLKVIQPSDFEVVQHGAYIKMNGQCTTCMKDADCTATMLTAATKCDTTLGKCIVVAP